ncbi:MAG: type II toxin-antitoxin system VapC family toxin [Epsilonproteobacteria bacterium]|nr:type II toxin-antitoxin system VapC family toxin [Campylobacterota bacterium]
MNISRVFLDANIFIDSQDDSRSRYEESYKIVPYLLKNNIRIYTSCDLITTIYYILAKKDKKRALQSIEELNKFCNIIEFSNKEVSQAVALMKSDTKFGDLEDTLQYVLAKKLSCEMIISNDQAFHSPDVELLSSTEFAKRFL